MFRSGFLIQVASTGSYSEVEVHSDDPVGTFHATEPLVQPSHTQSQTIGCAHTHIVVKPFHVTQPYASRRSPTWYDPGGGTGAAGRRVCGFSQGSRQRLKGAGRRPAKFFFGLFCAPQARKCFGSDILRQKSVALCSCNLQAHTTIGRTRYTIAI